MPEIDVTCIGTDPAGLYFCILMKRRNPRSVIHIIDRDPSHDTRTAGLHLSHPLRGHFQFKDAEVQALVDAAIARFDGVTIKGRGGTTTTRWPAYSVIAPDRLKDILKRRAVSLGCELRSAPADTASNIVLAADGRNSKTRDRQQDMFRPAWTQGRSSSVTFGVGRTFDNDHRIVRDSGHGLFLAHAYPNGDGTSTFVVEGGTPALAPAGADGWSPQEVIAFCEKVFADDLDGQPLVTQDASWRPSVRLTTRTLHAGNVVLIGEAAYTSHISVPFATRAALEDAEALAVLLSGASRDDALRGYDTDRRPKIASLHRAADAGQTWCEHVHRYVGMPHSQFAYSCLTRTMRINHTQVAQHAPELAQAAAEVIAGPALTGNQAPPPPMFSDYRMRGLTLPNRIALSPMCMYSAHEGTVNDFHVVHLGSRAAGGAGLIITEMTDVSPEGRITEGCAGMYADAHAPAWKRVVDFVHQHSDARIGIQLGHAGRKGARLRYREGYHALNASEWDLIAPSAIAFSPDHQLPRAMTRNDMERIRDAFVRAAILSDEAGFDMIELHMAHGYLLSSFISPLSNHRDDDYGGALPNRMRFPLEVFVAVRAVWPDAKPISVRISGYDGIDGGTTVEDGIEIGRLLHEAGNDILAVSTGAVTSQRRNATGRLYQTTFSDQIRNELGIPTMTVGGIASYGDANMIIAAGRADICALGRGYLNDPYFVRHAAEEQGYRELKWPDAYQAAPALRMRRG